MRSSLTIAALLLPLLLPAAAEAQLCVGAYGTYRHLGSVGFQARHAQGEVESSLDLKNLYGAGFTMEMAIGPHLVMGAGSAIMISNAENHYMGDEGDDPVVARLVVAPEIFIGGRKRSSKWFDLFLVGRLGVLTPRATAVVVKEPPLGDLSFREGEFGYHFGGSLGVTYWVGDWFGVRYEMGGQVERIRGSLDTMGLLDLPASEDSLPPSASAEYALQQWYLFSRVGIVYRLGAYW